MPLTFNSKGGGSSKRVTPGSHIAVCDMVVFLGLQQVGGMFPKTCNQLYIRFEVPNERWEFEKDGKKQEGPAVIGATFTASMHKKSTLRKQLQSWRGKEFTEDEASNFDVVSVLGVPCMLSVVEKESDGNIYSNVVNISALPKGIPKPSAELPLRLYTPDDSACFDELPEWLRDKITSQVKPELHTKPAADDLPPVDAYENIHGLTVSDDDLPENISQDYTPF